MKPFQNEPDAQISPETEVCYYHVHHVRQNTTTDTMTDARLQRTHPDIYVHIQYREMHHRCPGWDRYSFGPQPRPII